MGGTWYCRCECPRSERADNSGRVLARSRNARRAAETGNGSDVVPSFECAFVYESESRSISERGVRDSSSQPRRVSRMKQRKWRFLTQMGFLVGTACTQGQPPRDATAQSGPVADSAAAHRFAQEFYDWYTPLGPRPGGPSWFLLLSGRTFRLEADLVAALRSDSIARNDARQFRETLNFDPFLDSQDPCPRYAVSEVRRIGAKYRVKVKPVCANAIAQSYQTGEPVLEIVSESGVWTISDVFYSDSATLKRTLCGYAKDDLRSERRPKKCP